MSGKKNSQLPPIVPRYLSLFRAAKFISNPIPILGSYLQDYGPTYMFHIGGFKKGFLTTDPGIIQHVLQKNHRNYRKSDIQTGLLAHYIGRGLLTSEGPYWLRQRRLIQPSFHRLRLAKLVSLMNEEIRAFIERWRKTSIAQNPVDLYKEMHFLAFRIIAKALFSTSMSEEQMTQLSDQITKVQKFIVRQIRQPYANWWFKLSGQIRSHEYLSQSTKEILVEIIKTRQASKSTEDDLLQMLLDAKYEGSDEGMTTEQLLDECLILFVAGHETSANALTWALYLLFQNPSHIEKLRREAKIWNTKEAPSFEDLSDLTYTQQVIEETMRLYPPAWIIDRVAEEDDYIGGFTIARDAMVILYTYGTHRSALLWEEPDDFRPERFQKEKQIQIQPFAYFPFGGGPRLCIGNNFALMEMQLILTQLYHHFDFTLISETVNLLPLITLRPEEPLLFNIKPRT